MGCDIHLVLEKKWTDHKGRTKWVGIPMERCPRTRNYHRFGLLAGVRGDGPDARGLPDDASDLARMEIERWDGDGHSHSWCPLREFVQACLASEHDPEKMLDAEDPRTKDPFCHYFGLEFFWGDDGPDNYRVVFWFDN